jgi:hypothetical protein
MLCRKLTNPGARTPTGKAKLHVHKTKLDELVKSPKTVIPAKAGIHK